MYGKNERRDAPKGNLNQNTDITQLFNMLESYDDQAVEEVKTLIHENLAKDVWLLHNLVDYYIAAQSKRALDILVRVREPQDKQLFDKLVGCMKDENTRNMALLLLSHITYRQPPWLHRITQHRAMNELLNILKVEMDAANLVCGLLIVVSLLPMFPSKFGPYLPEIFEIFARLASWSTKKPSTVPEVYVLHLQVGVYNLFLRLYGLFPCNFLAYLRSYYGSRDFSEETLQVFTVTIKPMLERVRLHPFLVTASKESEIHLARWKKMETHDILTECANISLDASNESSGPYRSSAYGSGFSAPASLSIQDSTQFPSCSSQSSTISVTLDSLSLVNTAMTSSQDMVWTPSQSCGRSTSPSVLAQQQYEVAEPVKSSRYLSTQTSVSSDVNMGLDIAQEAKPESLKGEVPISKLPAKNLSQDTQDNEPQVDVAEEAQALEEKEDVTDKEVSDLTSKNQSEPSEELRQATPFCCTTQNLTDEPLTVSKNAEGLPLDLEHDMNEDLELSTEMECDIKVENLVKKLNRMRFFSHCGMPPEVPHSAVKPSKLHRSQSWPSLPVSQCCDEDVDSKFLPKPLVLKTSLPPDLDQHPPACGFVSLDSSVQSERMPAQVVVPPVTPLDHLLPMAISLPVKLSSTVVKSCTSITSEHYSFSRSTDSSFHGSLSPIELLDRHLQLGSDTYVSQLNFIPITSMNSTNWTHFGGQPPADEVAILRKRISMLHYQLLFERHLREMHGVRNRRLLGKSKWTRMQEEYTVALKDQVQLNEKENQELKLRITLQSKLHTQFQKEKQQSENDLHDHIRKLQQENAALAFTNKKLQGLLVIQKEDYDKLSQDFKDSQSEILDIKHELELSQKEVARCQKLEKDVTWLTKELVLLQELNQHYKDKLDILKTPQLPEVEVDLIKDAAHAEINALKQQLEYKTSHLDVAKSKISELELLLSNMKSKLAEQKSIIDTMRSVHKDEVMVREDRISELCRINQQNEVCILEQYQKQDLLTLENEALKSQQKRSSGHVATLTEHVSPSTSGIHDGAAAAVNLGDMPVE